MIRYKRTEKIDRSLGEDRGIVYGMVQNKKSKKIKGRGYLVGL